MVIRFDLNVLPAEINIQKAYFDFYCHFTSPGVDVCSLFIVQSEWDVSKTTWMNATAADKWNKPGGDYISKEHVLAKCAGDGEWERYDVTEFVRYFYENPEKNLGFINSLQDIHATNYRKYYSSKFKFIEFRPKLVIQYGTTDIKNNPTTCAPYFSVLIEKQANNVNLFIPFSRDYSFTITDLKGRNQGAFSGHGKQWYTISNNSFFKGMNLITVKTDDEYSVQKVLFME